MTLSYRKISVTPFVFISILTSLIAFTVIIFENIKDNRVLGAKSENQELSLLVKEFYYWEDLIKKQPSYRDGYLKLSLLAYKLDDIESAFYYIDKTLLIDPNSKKALDLKQYFQENN